MLKFLKWVYLNNHLSESIHTWVMRTLEGLLTFHEFWPPESMPQGGAGGENLGHPKKVLYCFFFYDYPFLRH